MTVTKLTARNYAEDHTNKIHSDETARQYGFTGALVPGVGIYSYLIEPVVNEFGDQWLQQGSASVKFLKPVYDGSEVTVHGKLVDPSTMHLEIYDEGKTLCAVGEAALPRNASSALLEDYPLHPLPKPEDRRLPLASALHAGDVLGSLDGILDLEKIGAHFGQVVRRPALLLALANDLVAGNIALGPWIHTASTVTHFGMLNDGEPYSVRGCVTESGEKRGHDYVVVDLAVHGLGDRPIAAIRHSALIRLRASTASGE